MYVTEFLNRTNRRNLYSQIDCQVQRQLKECAEDLEHRRRQLAELLQSEERGFHLEMEELLRAEADASQNQRIEWIQMSLMNSEQAEQELIKQKKLQREIENSQEHRHLETKQILLASKQAQLYQIEERKELKRRAALKDKFWQQNRSNFKF